MNCNPGDLVGIPFPYSDLRTKKRRPVLVITSPDHHGDFIGLAVTSVPAQGWIVPIDEQSMASGRLPKPSWIRCDKVFTLQQEDIAGGYGTLKAEVFHEAMRVMCRGIGCR
ncbi:type II toxin-antitoxin system PemK/MazF family toxin [Desulforhabdus sp. TSK]|jgi:mRNA interferase MazF|uniref:type II toxin-antitoxin system PemK/MazF family toxin n=1 Tax=Desulforhabdus sp. TSK TaxID=2925014 RepID=UPI00208AE4CD|nr:hypothetical protein DSTSK_19160 [Desulforhabdus sp. TSK]